MRRVELTNVKISFPPEQITFAEINGIGYNKWNLSYNPTRCRSYLNNWASCDPKIGIPVTILTKTRPKKLGKAFIFYSADFKKTPPDFVEKQLEILHNWEKIAGVSPTKVFQTQDSVPGYIFVGDKHWVNALWKVSLYSYFLKKILFNAKEYDNYIKEPILGKFLKKITANIPEKLLSETRKGTDVYSAVHAYSGVVTISQSYTNPKSTFFPNTYMANLLLGDNK